MLEEDLKNKIIVRNHYIENEISKENHNNGITLVVRGKRALLLLIDNNWFVDRNINIFLGYTSKTIYYVYLTQEDFIKEDGRTISLKKYLLDIIGCKFEK